MSHKIYDLTYNLMYLYGMQRKLGVRRFVWGNKVDTNSLKETFELKRTNYFFCFCFHIFISHNFSSIQWLVEKQQIVYLHDIKE